MHKFVALPVLRDSQLTYQKETEEDLIEAAKANSELFGVLYQRYVTQVYRYIRTRVDSTDDAADLTQQTFLGALHSLPRYRSRGVPFSAWLFRIAQYTITNKRRKNRVTISWDLLPEEMHHSFEQEPEGLLLQQERLERLRQLLSQQSPYKRELLALRFAAGLSSTEIAAVVGKSPASVKKELTRLLHTLKEYYHEA